MYSTPYSNITRMLIHPPQSGADTGFLGPEFYTFFGVFSEEHKITKPKLGMRMNI
jgi:hypothetical protein